MFKKLLGKKAFSISLCFILCLTLFSGTSSALTVTATQQDTIFKLTSIFENSTTELQYTYCENIGDGRGYTFGFAGFCSGTYDGTMFLKKYQTLNPNNILVKYIPKFEYIDSLPHPNGLCSNTTGLENFPADFRSCGSDPAFKQAQHDLVNQLYWNPSQVAVNEIGAQYPITAGELYDAFINHGEDGARDIINRTNNAVGRITAGISEKVWLDKFLSIRLGILQSDPTWLEAVDRVKVYQKLLNTDNNLYLTRPLTVTCYGGTYTITGDNGAVATPAFTPAGGIYTSAQNVTISCATAGATIRYTTDGSTPTSTSTAYTGPISVTSTRTIKAIAIKSGMTNSAVASATYTINSTPTNGVTFYQDINYGGASATLQPGSYTMAQMAATGVPNNWMSSLKVPSGWTVEVYDGDNFTGTKWTYTASSSWVGSTVNDKMTSVKIFSGTISTVATPTFSPAGGTYTSAQNVTISCATAGATIRYTTDGSTPTASSTAYTGPISVTSTKTIKTIAIKSGMNNSAVASATYTISSSGYPAWAPNTAYSVGAIVSYNGSNYRCIQAHTSLVGWEPSSVASLWTKI